MTRCPNLLFVLGKASHGDQDGSAVVVNGCHSDRREESVREDISDHRISISAIVFYFGPRYTLIFADFKCINSNLADICLNLYPKNKTCDQLRKDSYKFNNFFDIQISRSIEMTGCWTITKV